MIYVLLRNITDNLDGGKSLEVTFSHSLNEALFDSIRLKKPIIGFLYDMEYAKDFLKEYSNVLYGKDWEVEE